MKIKVSWGKDYTFWLYRILALNSTKYFSNGKLVGNIKWKQYFRKEITIVSRFHKNFLCNIPTCYIHGVFWDITSSYCPIQVFFFLGKMQQYNPGWSETCSAEAGLGLLILPLPSRGWDDRCAPPWPGKQYTTSSSCSYADVNPVYFIILPFIICHVLFQLKAQL